MPLCRLLQGKTSFVANFKPSIGRSPCLYWCWIFAPLPSLTAPLLPCLALSCLALPCFVLAIVLTCLFLCCLVLSFVCACSVICPVLLSPTAVQSCRFPAISSCRQPRIYYGERYKDIASSVGLGFKLNHKLSSLGPQTFQDKRKSKVCVANP